MFRAHQRSAALLTVPVLALSLAAGSVTVAAPAFAASAVAAATAAADDAIFLKAKADVERLRFNDPREEVRTAARGMLLMEDPKDPVRWAQWKADLIKWISTDITSGYMQAREKARKNLELNNYIIAREIRLSTPARAPYTHLTASIAQGETHDGKNRYVQVGLPDAKRLDAQHSPYAYAQEQVKKDRDYVAELSRTASGAWVKAAAARAVQVGTNDAIADFYKHTWASGAECDLQAFRQARAELTVKYQHELNDLVKKAKDAQEAYLLLEGAARAKKIEEAKLNWDLAAGVAASTQATWEANAQLAASQAQVWQSVREFAEAASTREGSLQDWTAIAGNASGTSSSWAEELAWAQQQAADWTELEETARTSAAALPVVTPTPSASA